MRIWRGEGLHNSIRRGWGTPNSASNGKHLLRFKGQRQSKSRLLWGLWVCRGVLLLSPAALPLWATTRLFSRNQGLMRPQTCERFLTTLHTFQIGSIATVFFAMGTASAAKQLHQSHVTEEVNTGVQGTRPLLVQLAIGM